MRLVYAAYVYYFGIISVRRMTSTILQLNPVNAMKILDDSMESLFKAFSLEYLSMQMHFAGIAQLNRNCRGVEDPSAGRV